MLTYQEPFLEERMASAKERAKSIAQGSVKNESDLEQVFRAALSRRYGIPLRSEYFEDLTLDELAYEVFLHKELDDREAGNSSPQAAEEHLSKVSDEERDTMFDDLDESLDPESDFATRWAKASETPADEA